MRFSVRGFGCALFYFGGKENEESNIPIVGIVYDIRVVRVRKRWERISKTG